MTIRDASRPGYFALQRASRGGFLRRVLPLVIGLLALAGGGLLSAFHPFGPRLPGALFLAWVALSWWRTWLWLVLLPACLPVLGFAPWTGWMSFEEIDLVVLGALAGGYLAMVTPGKLKKSKSCYSGSVGIVAILLLALYGLSQTVSLGRGIADAGGFRFGWFQGYEEPMNSVRLFKAFLWAALLLPLLGRELRADDARASVRLVTGLCLGLFGAGLATMWERAAFTDLSDFSSDYRTTALFWEMHVGGAALDGFLALTVPFAVWWIVRSKRPQVLLPAAALMVLGGYACLTTFSRGLYLALAVSLLLLFTALAAQYRTRGQVQLRQTVPFVFLMVVATTLIAWLVFPTGGYRALIAQLSVLMAVAPVAVAVRGASMRSLAIALGLGGLMGGVHMAVVGWLGRGTYTLFSVAALAVLMLIVRSRRSTLVGEAVLLIGAFFWLCIAAVQVAWHWGGYSALGASTLAILLPIGWVIAGRHIASMAPGDRRVWIGAVAAAVLAAGSMTVFFGGAYMGTRVAETERDFDVRLRHWKGGLSMLQGQADWVFGKGLGRFPAAAFFGALANAFPGSYSIMAEDENRFLRLSAPRHATGWGQLLRVSQRVPAVPGIYRLRMDVRATKNVTVQVEVCEKHLLYNADCAVRQIKIKADRSGWQPIELTLDGRAIRGGPSYAPRLAFFSIALDSLGATADIDNVDLFGPQGDSLLNNGGFQRDMAYWFFTSDRDHLPWHIKSIFVNALFDQGFAGLTAFLTLTLGALGRITLGQARAHPLSPYLAASITGFLIVGLFDSLLDVPRVALLFYLLIFIALIVRPDSAAVATTGCTDKPTGEKGFTAHGQV